MISQTTDSLLPLYFTSLTPQVGVLRVDFVIALETHLDAASFTSEQKCLPLPERSQSTAKTAEIDS